MARTRSIQAHQKVLQATLALFERGIDSTSMEAIAEKSGVSKATIYKHWQDKDALALEALSLMFGLDEEAPRFDSGDLRQDLVDTLTYQPAPERQEMKNRMMPHVMAYAARNREFGEQWRTRVIEHPQTRLKTLIKRGIAQNDLIKPINLDTCLALLSGPMLYWHIFARQEVSRPDAEGFGCRGGECILEGVRATLESTQDLSLPVSIPSPVALATEMFWDTCLPHRF